MFVDRKDAGEKLASRMNVSPNEQIVVIGLARGGIVIAKAIGDRLSCPFDILVVKKLTLPIEPELAIGAVAPDSVSVVNHRLAQQLGADSSQIQEQISDKSKDINRQENVYRKARSYIKVKRKTVIIADDGAATGATMEVSIKWMKKKSARKIIVAIPVAPKDVVEQFKKMVDDVVVLETPEDFQAVGQFYTDFKQVEDEEVVRVMRGK
ncbi:phosphoribosyltransferase [Patescibacteria group bacterium]